MTVCYQTVFNDIPTILLQNVTLFFEYFLHKLVGNWLNYTCPGYQDYYSLNQVTEKLLLSPLWVVLRAIIEQLHSLYSQLSTVVQGLKKDHTCNTSAGESFENADVAQIEAIPNPSESHD